MKKHIVSIIVIVLILFNIILIYTPENTTKGTNVSGTQTGLWAITGSPYIVTDDVKVPSHSFLDIQPGVEVRFQLDTKMTVMGTLYANGTASNQIIFTSDLLSPYIYCWEGVHFKTLGNGRLQNCSISWARNGINAKDTYMMSIKYCNIYNCDNGTRFNGVTRSSVENCRIHDNMNNGFQSKWGYGYIRVMNNTFYNNAKAVRFVDTWLSIIANNTIYNNMRGIRLKGTYNCLVIANTINDTHFPSPVPDHWETDNFGIGLNRSISNLVVNNKITNTTDHGIKLKYSSYNNTFDKNYIENCTGYGIYLFDRCMANYFNNTSIINTNKSAIMLELKCNGNLFTNNSITKFNDRYGVEYQNESYWNWFHSNNKINTVPLRIYYNVPGNIITSEIKGASVSEPLMTNLGQIVIIDCVNFSIHSAIIANGQSGIFLYEANVGTIVNSTINNNNDYAIHFGYFSTNITVANASLTIPFLGLGYFYLDEYANASILNTTFDQSKVVFEPHSSLLIQWYLHVKVIDSSTSQNVADAKVRVTNQGGELVYNGSTTDQGVARFIPCTQKIIRDEQEFPATPHNVTAIKIHFQPGYAGSGVVMDESKWVTVELQDNQLPSLAGVIDPPITHNRTPRLSWLPGTDPDSDLLLYWVKLWNNKQPNIVIEENCTHKTEYNVKTNLSYGERYTVELTASDPYGGWSNSLTGSFSVINQPPEPPEILIKPLQSDTTPSKNDDLNCTIKKPSVDQDDKPKDIIKYTYLWYKNNIFQENLSVRNTSKLYHVLSKNYTETGDVWTAEVLATDGFEMVKAEPQIREIRNNPPRVKKTIPILNIMEDTLDSKSINLQDIFYDDDGESLKFSYNITSDNISIRIFQENGTVIITPKPDWNGFENAEFFASDEETFAYIKTKIKVLPVNDPPEVEIILPRTNKYFIYNLTRGISLVGAYDDADILYGDVINLTWTSNITGVLGYESQLDDVILPIGDHSIEFIAKDSENVMDIDTIIVHIINMTDLNFTIPEVKLLRPYNNETINKTSIMLSWKLANLNASDIERVLFDVYLDTSPIPSNLVISEYLDQNITVTELKDNTTYYWIVIPYLDEFQGICIDWVWNFTIDLNFTSLFGVELSMTEKELSIEAGVPKVFNFTIKNTGNIVDKFRLSLWFRENNTLLNYTILEVNNITLQSLYYTRINLTFNIPKNYTSTKDTMILKAESIIGPALTNITRNITILGIEGSPVVDAPAKIPESFMNMLLFLIIILIVIAVILIILIMILMLWFKRQARMNYPIKAKTVVRKERTLSKGTELRTAQPEVPIQTAKPIMDKPPKAKPAHPVVKGAKLAAVTPIRITSIFPESPRDESETEEKTKPVAKPVQRESEFKQSTKTEEDSNESKKPKD